MSAVSDEECRDLLPGSSSPVYENTWNTFRSTWPPRTRKPSERVIMNFMKNEVERHMSIATLWTTYSMLNTGYQIRYGRRLQEVAPNVQRYLKRIQRDSDPPRQAKRFSVEEMRQFTQQTCTDAYTLVRCVCALFIVLWWSAMH